MRTRVLRLTVESCPHDLFGKFELAHSSVRFVPSELTKAFRDGDTLTIGGLENVDRFLALTVYGVMRDLKTIELPNGTYVDRNPNFTVILEPAPGFKVHPIINLLRPTS